MLDFAHHSMQHTREMNIPQLLGFLLIIFAAAYIAWRVGK
jgi:hypothetical protein